MSDSTSKDNPDRETAADQPQAAKLKELAPLMQLLDQARDVVIAGNTSPLAKVQPPTKLGDFDLLSPIGRGGMGVVYEARQRSLDRIVALKVLPKSQVTLTNREDEVASPTDKNLIQRFHTEARAAARLHHANIVPVFGFGEADGHYFFVMQRIYGRNLDRWISDHVSPDAPDPISDDKIAESLSRFGFQAASGLAYAHAQGILHRDIKPANLLIDEDGMLQIADFGVARIEDAEAYTRTSDVIGTLRYMAPEQLGGEACAQSDVYSLGVTLYEIVTGKPAMDDQSVRQAVLLQKKPSGPIPLSQCKPSLPLDLRTIIEKAMQREQRYRYDNAQSLADDLQNYIEGRPIKARRLGVAEHTIRWVRRNQTVSVLATLLFLALGFTALVSILDQREIRKSFDRAEDAREATGRVALLADVAIESVFDRFSTTADATTIDYDAVDFSAPAVDLKTPELLLKLIQYYDGLTAESFDLIELRLSPAQVRMHLATIHGHLDNHQAAATALEDALSEIGSTDLLMRATILNRLGIAQQMLGENRRSKQSFRDAYQLLLETEVSQVESDPHQEDRRQFELARSELLLARKPRPGMGPHSLPPDDAFNDNPWKPFRASLRPNSPQGRIRPPRNEETEALLSLAIERLGALLKHNEDHVPTMLLLSCTLRNAMRDVLRARQSRHPIDRRLTELADWVQVRLQSKMDQSPQHEQDAIIAYEQVLLLTDFDVFRALPLNVLERALRDSEIALRQADRLVDNYPNVSAYEVLAIHTAFKLATLKTRHFAVNPNDSIDELREVRALIRRALRRQSRLLRRTDQPSAMHFGTRFLRCDWPTCKWQLVTNIRLSKITTKRCVPFRSRC